MPVKNRVWYGLLSQVVFDTYKISVGDNGAYITILSNSMSLTNDTGKKEVLPVHKRNNMGNFNTEVCVSGITKNCKNFLMKFRNQN